MSRFSTILALQLTCFAGIFKVIHGQEIQNEFPEKCLEGLGCYATGPPFYEPPHRPLSLLPFNKSDIATEFLLFTVRNSLEAEIIKEQDDFYTSMFFDCWSPTKIIIPGYNAIVQSNDSYHLLKTALLNYDTFNVIIVDWSSSNQAPYSQAVANARVVATQIAKLIQFVIDQRCIYAESVHLIGHGLGAHLAGWTGSQIRVTGRITGLDPAGEYFYEAPQEVRLDDKDALFVDVIHTNGGTKMPEGFGLEEAIGHLDFYPNGGRRQPGCFNSSIDEKSDEDYDPLANRCSHDRAVFLFIESIGSEHCRFKGVECDSYEHFLRGRCRRPNRRYPIYFIRTAEMGLHAQKPYQNTRGEKYFLQTNADPPYCKTR